MSSPPTISPDWTLDQLKETFPGVELTLFSFFGIGSRERSGFSGAEVLEELLRRHLVFDAKLACAKLNQLAQEDWNNSFSGHQLSEALEHDQVIVVDARSEEDFRRCKLHNAQLLSADTVYRLKSQAQKCLIVTVCGDGSQSPAASRILRRQGLNAQHLQGGLQAWSRAIDQDFPVLFPLVEEPGQWSLLADGETLRYRRTRELRGDRFRLLSKEEMVQFSAGRALMDAIPTAELVAYTPRSFAVRGLPDDLHLAVKAIPVEIRDSLEWNDWGSGSEQPEEKALLEKVLAEEAPKILASHKGTVEVESYQDRILTLVLGGGCAGCASAQITTQRELAGALYRAVPLLDRIEHRA